MFSLRRQIKARGEAEAIGKKPITLIDKEALVDLILEHYDDLDEQYKSVLMLKRRDIPIRDRFSVEVST